MILDSSLHLMSWTLLGCFIENFSLSFVIVIIVLSIHLQFFYSCNIRWQIATNFLFCLVPSFISVERFSRSTSRPLVGRKEGFRYFLYSFPQLIYFSYCILIDLYLLLLDNKNIGVNGNNESHSKEKLVCVV